MTRRSKWQRFWSWRGRLQRYVSWAVAQFRGSWDPAVSPLWSTGGKNGITIWCVPLLWHSLTQSLADTEELLAGKSWRYWNKMANNGRKVFNTLNATCNLPIMSNLALAITTEKWHIVQLWLILLLLLLQITPPQSEIFSNGYRTMNFTELQRMAPGYGVRCFLCFLRERWKSEWRKMTGVPPGGGSIPGGYSL